MADVFDESFAILARGSIEEPALRAARILAKRWFYVGYERFLPDAAVVAGPLDPGLALRLSDAAAVWVRYLGDQHAARVVRETVDSRSIDEAFDLMANGGYQHSLADVLEASGIVDHARRLEVDTEVISYIAGLAVPGSDEMDCCPRYDEGVLKLRDQPLSRQGIARARHLRDILRRSLLPPLPDPESVAKRLGLKEDVALTARLGQGLAGPLFRGRHADRDVAVRIVCVPDPDVAKALRDRVERAKGLGAGSGLAAVTGVWTFEGGLVIAREMVLGDSLSTAVEKAGRIESEGLTLILSRGAACLDRLHGAGCVHGAIHPRNVILAQDGPVLTDAELAGYPFLVRSGPYHPQDPGLATGNLPLFAETPAQDLYSLGATVHFAATGNVPARPIPSIGVDVLSMVVDRLVLEDPWERITEAAALIALLGGESALVKPEALKAAAPVAPREAADVKAMQGVRKTIQRAVPKELIAPEPPAAAKKAEPPKDKLIGRSFGGRYEVVERLGRGGMGVVYRARQTFMNRDIALKVLLSALIKDDEAIARFQREAQAAARIVHEHVVQTHDAGEVDGMYYIAMEYVPGETLKSLVKRKGALPIEAAVQVMGQVLAGMECAHRQGIVHRDLKSDNILLRELPDGRVLCKVADFGLAHLQEDADDLNPHKFRTRAGLILGTAEYMSPEQASGLRADLRSDIYAAGIILYEVLAGRLPFDATTLLGYIGKHVVEIPPPIAARSPHGKAIPACLEEAAARALKKRPEERFQSAGEFRQAIQPALGGKPWWAF